ncbi:MAG: hypothetical protein V1644_02040 [Candidatus Micrarchaeota archaeon]
MQLKFLPIFLVLFFSFFSLAFAQDVDPSVYSNLPPGVSQSDIEQFRNTAGQSALGTDIGKQVGSSLVEGVAPGLGETISQAKSTAKMILQLIVFAFTVFALFFVVWLVVLLIVLRNIMKRDDLTGGEKAAWVMIVFFFGFIPLSPIGLLLYVVSGGKNKPTANVKK